MRSGHSDDAVAPFSAREGDVRLQDRTAIVTGGASGFGEGIVRRFAEEGATVLVADLNEAGAEAVVAAVGGLAHAMDVSRDADWAAVTARAMEAWGRIDILVNNAGITHMPKPMEEVTEPEFDRVLAVNAKSVYLSARHVVPVMKAAGRGAILNVASTAGVSPRPRLNWYNASKGWMITATKAMAVELAPAGLRVNCLNPVAGETPLLASFMGEDTPEMRAKFLATIPLGRFSTPQDLGAAAAFLCSDDASMITGVGLEVDGGRCI
jgi:3-oxoacyl-[acyl-carrier protein] reductase